MKPIVRIALALCLVHFTLAGCGEDTSIPQVVPTPDAFQPPILDAAVDLGVAIDAMVSPDLGLPQDPCSNNSDCRFGYCVPGPDGQRVCTEQCRDNEDCPEGWECRAVANTRPDTVFICVALRQVECLPCNHDGDCGSGPDRCIEIGQSNRCARDCSTEQCPEGNTCTEVDIDGEITPLCIPDSGTCDPCVDPDGDGYGNEGECLGLDCNEEDPLSYEGAPERCDGLDNDCDTVPDNDVPLDGAPADLTCLEPGACTGAMVACLDGAWACNYGPQYEPDAELTCDGVDNDCDGNTDEAIEPPPATRVVGVCIGAVQVCGGESGFGEPNYAAIANYEAEEVSCDGLDNDCDNQTDETLMVPPADRQNGVCAGATKFCGGADGFLEPDYGQLAGYENIETTCDGLDNDCDGTLDENLTPPLGDRQNGVCAGAVRVCDGQNGFVEPDYAAIPAYAAEEATCDGLDNDCDGSSDEGVVLPFSDRQLGVCAGQRKVCGGFDGLLEPDYNAIPTYEATETLCDGLDNDCDGSVDEDITPPFAANQNGICAGSRQICQGVDGFIEPAIASLPSYIADDTPLDNLDTNCDGVVGHAGRLVFVSTTGADNNSGLSSDEPVRSITRALAVAAAEGGRDLAIASGIYDGDSALSLQSGVSLYGGFGQTFDSRDASRAVFTTSSRLGVEAFNLAEATRVDQVNIEVDDRALESEEAIGIFVVDSASNLLLSNLEIQTGRGGNGTIGQNGANGVAGRGGANAAGSSGGVGGDGGGGRGATGRRQASGPAGIRGANNNAQGGSGGSGSGNSGLGCNDGDPRSGGNGGNGSAGSDGAHNAAGDNLGRFAGLDWIAPIGSGGARGGQGGGGGGGGAGGGEDCEACVFGACTCIYCGTGRGGGGGGGGGTGGRGGSPGTSGGASIGIAISNSRITLINTQIVTSRGGAGGWGGAGGVGGAGGPGGSGGVSGDNTDGPGGDGGNGGRGGAGGCGAGGSGGPSIGFWGLADAEVVRSGGRNDRIAAGGPSGLSCGNAGPIGLTRQYHQIDLTIR